MAGIRTTAACLASVEAERREYDPTYRLDQYVSEARADMGEARWTELNAEWEASADQVHGANAHRLGQMGAR